jgi:hypothetical protein
LDRGCSRSSRFPEARDPAWTKGSGRETIGFMNAEAALEKQIELYRKMTGPQRLQIALELHEMSCEVSRAGIRRQFPGASAAEVEEKLRARIALERDDD